MDDFIFTEIIISGLLLCIFCSMFGRLRREEFRARIRDMRDELFDWMWLNNQDFSSPEYQGVRQTLNGLMRLSNRLGPIGYAGMFVIRTANGCEVHPSDVEMMQESPLKQKLKEVKTAAIREWLSFLYLGGFLGFVLRMIAAMFTAVSLINRMKQSFIASSDEALAAARDFGAPNLTTVQRTILSR